MKILNNLFYYKSRIVSIFNGGDKRRFKAAFFSTLIIITTVLFNIVLNNIILENFALKKEFNIEFKQKEYESIEQILQQNKSDVKGVQSRKWADNIRTDVGFIDVRVLALEEFFRHYNSPLEKEADEFIKAAEKYHVDNWQLLPAIGLAETKGCQTGISHQQRNCWGYGGSGENRWEFFSYAEAIDIITRLMKEGYSNAYLDPKSIQGTYCGRTCDEWGWRWARGVNYYIVKLNDFGEKYDLPRTHEVKDWSDPPSAN